MGLKAVADVGFFPDPGVTIDITLEPGATEDGAVHFDSSADSNVDTGILGDILAFAVGGPVLTLFLGSTGSVAGVVALEVTEYVAEGIVKKEVTTLLEGEDVTRRFACEDDNVVEVLANGNGGGLVEAFANAIPRSIPVGSDRPDPLHERTLVVAAAFDEVKTDAGGMAFAGKAEARERFTHSQTGSDPARIGL